MTRKHHLSDFIITSRRDLGAANHLLVVTPSDGKPLLNIEPGQFVNIKVADSPATFLRRPISICNFIPDRNEIWLMIKSVGEGTRHLCELPEGVTVNILYSLGNGFSLPETTGDKILLVGGGVGIAPLLYLGKKLRESGHNPVFLLGGRKRDDLLFKEEFLPYGEVLICTEDGSEGEKGLVTQHSAMSPSGINEFSRIYCCGPLPMMKAVAGIAARNELWCEVSLENKMACGVGACLCCVEDTKEGHKCVCSDGPVFNIKDLKW